MSTVAVSVAAELPPDPDDACEAGAPSLLAATKQMLEMIPAGASLPDILTKLCLAIDAHHPDMMSIVMLMDPDGGELSGHGRCSPTHAANPSGRSEAWLKTCPSQPSKGTGPEVTTLAQAEKALIEAALAETHGRVSGPRGAAAQLGIPRQTLESKIKTLRIDKPS